MMASEAAIRNCQLFMRAWGLSTNTLAFSVLRPDDDVMGKRKWDACHFLASRAQDMLLAPMSDFYTEVDYFRIRDKKWLSLRNESCSDEVARYISDNLLNFSTKIFFFENADLLLPLYDGALKVVAVTNSYGMGIPARRIARYLGENSSGVVVLVALKDFGCYFGRSACVRHAFGTWMH